MATKKKTVTRKGVKSFDRVAHFRCGKCNKWWSVGDAPAAKRAWHCTWCGNVEKL